MTAADSIPLVLIVDDEEEVREVYRLYLEQAGDMMVFGAASAHDALRRLERLQPDLVILDMALPDMNGLKLLAQLNRHPVFRRIPVIVLTGHDLAGIPEGAVRVFSKPLRPDDLLREVRAVLPPRRGPSDQG